MAAALLVLALVVVAVIISAMVCWSTARIASGRRSSIRRPLVTVTSRGSTSIRVVMTVAAVVRGRHPVRRGLVPRGLPLRASGDQLDVVPSLVLVIPLGGPALRERRLVLGRSVLGRLTDAGVGKSIANLVRTRCSRTAAAAAAAADDVVAGRSTGQSWGPLSSRNRASLRVDSRLD
jgi:hypothetical protein